MRMKFGDLILIVLFLFASFLPLVFFHVQQSNENNVVTTKYAIVKIKGKEVERFDLTKKQHILKIILIYFVKCCIFKTTISLI